MKTYDIINYFNAYYRTLSTPFPRASLVADVYYRCFDPASLFVVANVRIRSSVESRHCHLCLFTCHLYHWRIPMPNPFGECNCGICPTTDLYSWVRVRVYFREILCWISIRSKCQHAINRNYLGLTTFATATTNYQNVCILSLSLSACRKARVIHTSNALNNSSVPMDMGDQERERARQREKSASERWSREWEIPTACFTLHHTHNHPLCIYHHSSSFIRTAITTQRHI